MHFVDFFTFRYLIVALEPSFIAIPVSALLTLILSNIKDDFLFLTSSSDLEKDQHIKFDAEK